jgi:hypothetical protein
MSVYEKMQKASKERDTEAFMSLMHKDFVMVSHQDGSTNNKDDLGEMVNYMFSSDDFMEREYRCLFENDEAMVTHSFMDFPDGTIEAVLTFNALKDGQVIRMETGATLLEK